MCVPVCVRVCTQDEVELGVCLEGVVEGDEEGRLADVLQHVALGARVLRRLGFLDDGGLLQDLHGVQLSGVVAAYLSHQEHLTIRYHRRRLWLWLCSYQALLAKVTYKTYFKEGEKYHKA